MENQLPENTIPVNPDPTGGEHLIELMSRNHEESQQTAEHALEQSARNGETLEHSLEMESRINDGIQDVIKAVKAGSDNLKPQEVEDNTVFVVKGQKGDKGDQGIQGAKGEDAHTPTPEELRDILAPIIPEPIPGEKGDQGETGPRGPEGLSGPEGPIGPIGPEGRQGKQGTTGEDGRKIQLQELLDMLNGKLSYDNLKDTPNISALQARIAELTSPASISFLYELSDVDLSGIQAGDTIVWNGDRFVPGTASSSGGGYTYVEIPTGVIDGVNTVFTLAHAPSDPDIMLLILNGATQTQLWNDYSIVGDIITFASAPVGTSQLTAYYS